MFEQITLRDEPPPRGLVVVRLGARTLDDDLLGRSVEECHDRWGIWDSRCWKSETATMSAWPESARSSPIDASSLSLTPPN